MLQQTQVKTVIPYFKNFIQKFPSQKKLSEASEDQILAAWSGLGFYRRARNIFASKEIIKKEYGNKFPKKFNHIVTLPGIGKSTAGAILSLAYLDPHPILDGNVKRVISRFLNKDSNVLTESQLWKLSSEMINRDDCFSYTQGIMDLGATICTPSKPSCNECPVSSHCLSAFKVSPIKRNKVASTKKVISMNLSLIQTKKSLLLAKNETESIWKNLWLPFKSVSLNLKLNHLLAELVSIPCKDAANNSKACIAVASKIRVCLLSPLVLSLVISAFLGNMKSDTSCQWLSQLDLFSINLDRLSFSCFAKDLSSCDCISNIFSF